VVFYEVYRGLLHLDARKQLTFFLNLAATLTWDDLTQVDWETAAHLWADLRRNGRLVGDADILIGAYAMRHGAVVVTRNTRHFEYLGVATENWREGG
jgi:predicted nucleic acid-binding protein